LSGALVAGAVLARPRTTTGSSHDNFDPNLSRHCDACFLQTQEKGKFDIPGTKLYIYFATQESWWCNLSAKPMSRSFSPG
jgi:hypothetical protein